MYPQLAAASSLKPEVVENLDIMILRELTGGIYFGEPRGIRVGEGTSVRVSTRLSTVSLRLSVSVGQASTLP